VPQSSSGRNEQLPDIFRTEDCDNTADSDNQESMNMIVNLIDVINELSEHD